MKNYILITGASSGIGLEMAIQLAQKGFNLILVARSENKLNELKEDLERNYAIKVEILPADLNDINQTKAVYDITIKKNWNVTHLVNNAGVGIYGNFLNTSLEKELQMIDLNVKSLTLLTKLFARKMAIEQGGRILNVASLLSYLPFPYYSVYSATKAYVLAFSQTIASELEGSKVDVLALCPGPVDTGFTTNEMLKTKAYKTNKPISAAKAAQTGMEFLLRGKGVKVVGFNNWFISQLPRITPSSLMMKIKKSLASQN